MASSPLPAHNVIILNNYCVVNTSAVTHAMKLWVRVAVSVVYCKNMRRNMSQRFPRKSACLPANAPQDPVSWKLGRNPKTSTVYRHYPKASNI